MESKDEAKKRLLNYIKKRHSVADTLNLCYIYASVMSKSKQKPQQEIIEGIFNMNNINDLIHELLDELESNIEETYGDSDLIVFRNDYMRALEVIRERLEEFDGLQAEINQLEAENERLTEENEDLAGQMYGWQEDYMRLEKDYEKLKENS